MLCTSNNTISTFNNSTVVSGTINRRHPDVSSCRPQAWRVSLSKKTSSLEVQRNLLFYISIMFLSYSHYKVFFPVGRALVFIEGCEGSGCHMFTDSLFFLNVGIFGYAIYPLLCCCNDSEEKMCCVEFTEWIKWRGCWLFRERLWLRLWVSRSAYARKNDWFLVIDSRVNLLLLLPGHKPEGCKEQPNNALSI